MTHNELLSVLQLIRPKAEYVLTGEPPMIQWLDKTQLQPSEQELEQGLVTVNSLAYQAQREKQYPSIGDQLDAIWKGGDAMEAMRKQVMAVKNKFPKAE